MVAKEVYYDPTETIPELLLRIAPYKSREKVYELDQIANEMGHLVIRLPPYHCQYNPIELICAKVEGEFAQLNDTFRLSDVE
jgi:transposase